jgi:hypothetical protein
MKGRRFCDAFDIIKNATEELKMLLQNGFQECFQHLYSPCQKRIVAQGGCFKRNASPISDGPTFLQRSVVRRVSGELNPLTPELNPSAQPFLPRFFTGDFNF